MISAPHIIEGSPEELREALKALRGRYRLIEITAEREPQAAEIAAADARLLSHSIPAGYAADMNNESIDRDLAREYADTHETGSDGSQL